MIRLRQAKRRGASRFCLELSAVLLALACSLACSRGAASTTWSRKAFKGLGGRIRARSAAPTATWGPGNSLRTRGAKVRIVNDFCVFHGGFDTTSCPYSSYGYCGFVLRVATVTLQLSVNPARHSLIHLGSPTTLCVRRGYFVVWHKTIWRTTVWGCMGTVISKCNACPYSLDRLMNAVLYSARRLVYCPKL